MSVDKQLQKLEEEIKALKTSFEQSAASLNVYTTETTFDTSMNVTNFSNGGAYDPMQWLPLMATYQMSNSTRFDTETFVVTFTCDKGINTFASIEFKNITAEQKGRTSYLTHRRVPFAGGAKWIVTTQPNATLNSGTGFYTWEPTKIKIAVQSAAEGTLGVKMIWQ